MEAETIDNKQILTLVSALAPLYRDFISLAVEKKYEALTQRFPIGCTAQEFHEALLDWLGTDDLATPPEEAFFDFEYEDSNCTRSSPGAPVPSNEPAHSIQIIPADDRLERFLCHMYLWAKEATRTDLSVIMTVSNPAHGPMHVFDVDMRVI